MMNKKILGNILPPNEVWISRRGGTFFCSETEEIVCIAHEGGLVFEVGSFEELEDWSCGAIELHQSSFSYFCIFCTHTFTNNKALHNGIKIKNTKTPQEILWGHRKIKMRAGALYTDLPDAEINLRVFCGRASECGSGSEMVRMRELPYGGGTKKVAFLFRRGGGDVVGSAMSLLRTKRGFLLFHSFFSPQNQFWYEYEQQYFGSHAQSVDRRKLL